MVRRGEVWWYEHPEAGRRPFVVLTRDEAIPVVNQVLAVPVTRTIRNIPSEVPLGPDDGLPTQCVAVLDNVTTVRRALLTERLATLGPGRMAAICTALGHATAC